MLIDKSKQKNEMKANSHMDGSLLKKNNEKEILDKENSGEVHPIKQPALDSKSNSKGISPLKEGLSDTTFKILKSCCSMLLEDLENKTENMK